MLTIVKSSTARGKKLLASAIIFEGESLFDIYESFSREKENAFEDCLQMCYEENGFLFHICSHNSFQFSVAWETEEGTRLVTAKNSYLIV